MIAEFLPESYDEGFAISHPRKKYPFFRPTFPLGLYMIQPLEHKCSSFQEMLEFLKTCRYVADDDQYGRDYWTPADVFEQRRTGDCDCFAMWAWRQLVEMGYNARFVVGVYGLHSSFHAWTSFEDDGKHFLLDPVRRSVGLSMPRLETIFYRPWISAGWDGNKVQLYEHEDTSEKMPVSKMVPYLPEWASWQAKTYAQAARLLGRWVARRIRGDPPRR